LTLQFIAIRNCTVQLALLLYVVSTIGLQNLEKFGTQWNGAMFFCTVPSVQCMGLFWR